MSKKDGHESEIIGANETAESLLCKQDFQYELPDGDVLQLQPTSPLLDSLIMMQYQDSEPKPPVQEADYGNGVIREEENETDDEYLKKHQEWQEEVNSKIGIVKLSEGITLSKEQMVEVGDYKQRMLRLSVELPDEPILIFIGMKKISNEHLGQIGMKINRISRPTETLVETAGEG